MKTFWTVLIAALLISCIVLPITYFEYQRQSLTKNNEVYFGVTFGLNTTSEAKLLIDKVKGFTNLFIVNSWDLDTLNETVNGTSLTEVCDYATSQGLNIIVYFAFISHLLYPWHISWVENATARWGSRFLGIYYYDEPGGKQIDLGDWSGNKTDTYENVTNYDEAANAYTESLGSTQSMNDMKALEIKSFTSDYALQWFDYQVGYDTILTELMGTNETTKNQQISLCRGAANVQNKQWGAILTWSSKNPPYLESGAELLQDMLQAYKAGAKYIVIFNYPTYPESNPYGILTEDQFRAMENFWKQIHSTQKNSFGSIEGEAAFVLPKNYGWGMRNPGDRIWGLWNSDSLSATLWNQKDQLIKTYGLSLDIIYDDTTFNFNEKYSTIFFWNGSEMSQNT